MIKTGIALLLGALMAAGTVFAQKTFVCFENDVNQKLAISVCFDKNEKPLFVKYRGQKDSLPLVFVSKTRDPNPGGGIPAYYWSETYKEKYNGKTTGEYTFTNAGTYQLDVAYTRGKDKKDFYFRIMENSLIDDSPFRKKPCFD